MNYLTFEQFEHAMNHAFDGVIEPGRGIIHRGPHLNSRPRRYNSRALQRHHYCEVSYFVDRSGCDAGLPEVIWYWGDDPTTGVFSGFAALKRRDYYPKITAFQNALSFDPQALRRLYQDGPVGWHGIPWHVHLASVYCRAAFEPPPLALPWNGQEHL